MKKTLNFFQNYVHNSNEFTLTPFFVLPVKAGIRGVEQ